MPGSFQLLHCPTKWLGLLQLLGFPFVCDNQGVKVSAELTFKFPVILTFLDLDRPGIISPCYIQKVLYFFNFERPDKEAQRAHDQTMSSQNSRTNLWAHSEKQQPGGVGGHSGLSKACPPCHQAREATRITQGCLVAVDSGQDSAWWDRNMWWHQLWQLPQCLLGDWGPGG